jgi:hypothetical protein
MVQGGKKYETKMKSLDLKEVNSLEEYKSHMEAYYKTSIPYMNVRLNTAFGEVPFPSDDVVKQARQNALEIFEAPKY